MRSSLPERRERSDSEPAAARRLRSFRIFSLRVRRRRISGRRLGADMNVLLEKLDQRDERVLQAPPLRVQLKAEWGIKSRRRVRISQTVTIFTASRPAFKLGSMCLSKLQRSFAALRMTGLRWLDTAGDRKKLGWLESQPIIASEMIRINQCDFRSWPLSSFPWRGALSCPRTLSG